jgi:3-hydroxyisobutyrate dehydrogenase
VVAAPDPASSDAPPARNRVAFLGLGIMGSRMAANVAAAGFELTVWNRTEDKARRFSQQHRARIASTPADAARGADMIVTMVVDGPQVQHVLLGPDGAAGGARAGALSVDCSTIGPAWARSISSDLSERGVRMIDAPVTGSSPRAQDGTLTIMVGGDRHDTEQARPLLQAMGALVVYAGPIGHGQMVKLLNNSVAAINTATVAQALVLAARAGVDLDALTEVISAGSGASAMLELKAGPMRKHDYSPLFKLDHMLKDVALCLQEAEAAGMTFPLAAVTRDILGAASGRGLGQEDFAALLEVVEAGAGIRL